MPWGIAASVAGSVVSSALSDSGSGGTSGGSSPPVYQPTQQPKIEQGWLDAYKNYGDVTQGYYNQTQPLNQNLLGAQFNNGFNGDYLAGAGKAGQTLNTGGQNADFAGNTLFANGQYLNYLQNQAQGRFSNNIDNVQNATDTQYRLANSSNARFNGLIAQQEGQYGNVQNAQDGLYGAGRNALATTDQLVNQQRGQYGQIQNSSNNLYRSGNSILNTAFDPQNALFNQQSQLVTDQTRAAEYARGIQTSPLGASVEANALSNFDINWQNQQLQRQQSGVASAQGAYSGGQGLQNSYANNIAGLQATGYGTAANASSSALGLGNSYSNNIAGLQTGGNNNYTNLTGAAGSQFSNFQNAQANNASTWAGATQGQYNTGARLTQNAGDFYNAGGASQYNAQNNIYGNQNAALTNFNNGTQPYLTSLGNIQTQGQNYLTGANQAQQQGWNQNNINQQNRNDQISSFGNAAASAYRAYQNNTSAANQSPYLDSNFGDSSGSFSSDFGSYYA